MKDERIHCLNPWDVQSKHIMLPDGITETIYAGECRYGGGEAYVLYENTVFVIEGNSVDRKSGKNGKGWCKNVSPTLNTQDRHAVVYLK